MEAVSITNPVPVVLRPPALGYPIENSPAEIADQSQTETFVEWRKISDQNAQRRIANAQAAIAGRRPNSPIDMAPPDSADIVDLIA